MLQYLIKLYQPNTAMPTQQMTVNSPTRQVLFSALSADTEYYATVTAINSVGTGVEGAGSDLFRTLQVGAPSIPQNVRAQTYSASQILMQWDSPDDSNGNSFIEYSAQCVLSGSQLTFSCSANATLSCYVQGLTANSLYMCSVRALGMGGESPAADASPSMISTSEATSPGVGVRPSVLSRTSNSVLLRWVPPLETGGDVIQVYDVLVSSDGISFTHALRVDANAQPSLESHVRGLIALTPYYFSIRAINSVGSGPASPPSALVITLDPTPPQQPRITGVSYADPTVSALVSWTAPEDTGGARSIEYVVEFTLLGTIVDACSLHPPISGYTNSQEALGYARAYDEFAQSELPQFARSSQLSSAVFVQSGGTSLLEMALPLDSQASQRPAHGAVYAYRVMATSAHGTSPASPTFLGISPVAVPGAPGKPEYIQSSHNGVFPATQALLRWGAPVLHGCSTQSYSLDRYAQDDQGNWGSPVTVSAGLNLVFTDTGLQHTTTYKYAVTAISKVGMSVASQISEPFTTGKTEPSAVCELRVSATAVDILLEWSPPCDDGGAESPYPKYQIQFWRSNRGGDWNNLPDLEHTQRQYRHSLGRPLFDTEFTVQVRAFNSIGFSDWNRTTVQTPAMVACPQGQDSGGQTRDCSGRGSCSNYDGDCVCDSYWTGNLCDEPYGTAAEMELQGSIESFDVTLFAARLATTLNVTQERVPASLMTVQAGSVRVQFYILEAAGTSRSGPSESPTSSGAISASRLISDLESRVTSGEMVGLGVVSMRVVDAGGSNPGSGGGDSGGESTGGSSSPPVVAPALPACQQSTDSCHSCMATPGCGWCEAGAQSQCLVGSTLGPAIGVGQCSQQQWYQGPANQCPPTHAQRCASRTTCGDCVANDDDCAWCASSGTCVIQDEGHQQQCAWGWKAQTCDARCARTSFSNAMEGTIAFGDSKPGSELYYLPTTLCTWNIVPGQASYTANPNGANSIERVQLDIDRVDLGPGDRLEIYDSQRHTNLLVGFGDSYPSQELPLEISSDTGWITIEFSSDSTGHGTGFFATWKGNDNRFFDIYMVIAMTATTILFCMCLGCCWTRCRDPNQPIPNNFGADLHGTSRGADMSSIRKFPKFQFTAAHARKMDEVGQDKCCSICLGDYEDGEHCRLLSCGHCFHTDCVDAWLQINRICPLCKVDVHQLLEQDMERKRMERRKHRANSRAAKKRRKKQRKKTAGVSPSPVSGEQSPEDESPLEQFRRRQRELLLVGPIIPENSQRQSASSNGDEKVPDTNWFQNTALPPIPAPPIVELTAMQPRQQTTPMVLARPAETTLGTSVVYTNPVLRHNSARPLPALPPIAAPPVSQTRLNRQRRPSASSRELIREHQRRRRSTIGPNQTEEVRDF